MYYSITAKDLLGQPQLTEAQHDALVNMEETEFVDFVQSFDSSVIMRLIPTVTRGDTIWLEDQGCYRNDGIYFWDGTIMLPVVAIPELDYGVPPFYVGDEFPLNHFDVSYCKMVTIDIKRHRDELIRNLTPLYTSFNGIKIYIVTTDPYRSYMDLMKIFVDGSDCNFRKDMVNGSLCYYPWYNEVCDKELQLERLGCHNIVMDDSDTCTFQFGSETLSCIMEPNMYDISLDGTIEI